MISTWCNQNQVVTADTF